MNFGMLLVMVLIKLFRGPGGGKESMIGLQTCDTWAWIAFSIHVLVAVLLTAFAARLANNDFRKKKELGYNFTKGDQEFSTRVIVKLVSVAFLVAIFASLAGLGPGIVFNSMLVQLDMHPAVASATGMYCTMFTTLACTLIVILNAELNIPYAGLLIVITLLGTLPGLKGQNWIVQKAKGRTQFTVAILFSFILLQLVTILPLSVIESVRASDQGEDPLGLKDLCR